MRDDISSHFCIHALRGWLRLEAVIDLIGEVHVQSIQQCMVQDCLAIIGSAV